MKKEELLSKFKEELVELSHLNAALAVLSWDQEVFMPSKGIQARAQTISSLAVLSHKKITSKKFEKILSQVEALEKSKKLNPEEECILREVRRDFLRVKKLPSGFVKELSYVCSIAKNSWIKARSKSDFSVFLPHLENIIRLKRKEAELVGFKKNPYDALLDSFEPGMTTEELSVIFNDLKKFLLPFLGKVGNSKARIGSAVIKGNFPIDRQVRLNRFVAEKMGFDFEAGRLDISTHPFTTSFSPEDVRITTRFKKDDLLYSLFSTIHEAGHALYEQGILKENFGTPLGESMSLGIHESQSRIWENVIGRSKVFCKFLHPYLRRYFPKQFEKIKPADLYRIINQIAPSLIRTEADEVTYNLHIIIRFEIEKELIDGSIEARDLPKIWNDKMKEYLGIDVPNDACGVLQDVHWSEGYIGYFPAYTLGNLYSAQFYEAAKKNITNLEEELSKGNFSQFREWLRNNIHVHGKFYSTEELVRKISGESLNSRYFIKYVKDKYSEIYKLD